MSPGDSNTNVILIGMPGAGKSTLGVLLAKKIAYNFIDTDLLIQSEYGQGLQEIIENSGFLQLRQLEEKVLLNLDVRKTVIATGGSSVYSDTAMKKLKQSGYIIYLEVTLEELGSRIGDYSNRGVAKNENQSFTELYAERQPLYQRYADIHLDCSESKLEETCTEAAELILSRFN